jgi:hypothetical protein
MYRREYPITPSQQAITGALSIYVEGGKNDDPKQMLFGLSVLRQATEEQIGVAMPLVEVSQGMTRAGMREMLAR